MTGRHQLDRGRLDLRLMLVTDRGLAERHGRSLEAVVRAAVDGGATIVQLRAKHESGAMMLDSAASIAALLAELGVPFLINDRLDIALAVRACGLPVAGVHLGQSDLPVRAARAVLAAQQWSDAVVGVSASTPAQLDAAEADGADYVGIGAVFATSTKPDAPPELGVKGFASLATASTLPAVAIGGVTARDVAALKRADAAGLAVVSAICAAEDPASAAAEIRTAWTVPATSVHR